MYSTSEDFPVHWMPYMCSTDEDWPLYHNDFERDLHLQGMNASSRSGTMYVGFPM
jgi:hypothetical protein